LVYYEKDKRGAQAEGPADLCHSGERTRKTALTAFFYAGLTKYVNLKNGIFLLILTNLPLFAFLFLLLRF